MNESQSNFLDLCFGDFGDFSASIKESKIGTPLKLFLLERAISDDSDNFLVTLAKHYVPNQNKEFILALKLINGLCFNKSFINGDFGIASYLDHFFSKMGSVEPERFKSDIQKKIKKSIINSIRETSKLEDEEITFIRWLAEHFIYTTLEIKFLDEFDLTLKQKSFLENYVTSSSDLFTCKETLIQENMWGLAGYIEALEQEGVSNKNIFNYLKSLLRIFDVPKEKIENQSLDFYKNVIDLVQKTDAFLTLSFFLRLDKSILDCLLTSKNAHMLLEVISPDEFLGLGIERQEFLFKIISDFNEGNGFNNLFKNLDITKIEYLYKNPNFYEKAINLIQKTNHLNLNFFIELERDIFNSLTSESIHIIFNIIKISSEDFLKLNTELQMLFVKKVMNISSTLFNNQQNIYDFLHNFNDKQLLEFFEDINLFNKCYVLLKVLPQTLFFLSYDERREILNNTNIQNKKEMLDRLNNFLNPDEESSMQLIVKV